MTAKRDRLLVGWTTIDSRHAANKLASALVASRLAACVQVDGPVTSHYRWKGKQHRATEWRLWVKFPASNAKKISAWLETYHTYDIHQWLVLETTHVAQAYHAWAIESAKPAY